MSGVVDDMVFESETMPEESGIENGPVFTVTFGIKQHFFEEIWLFESVVVPVGGIFECILNEAEQSVGHGPRSIGFYL